MKSWWLRDAPEGALLEMHETPMPMPAKGELRIKVRAASLNRGEFLRSPSYASSGEWRPAGSDCAGEVDALGQGVRNWHVGQRVMGPARGAYSEFALIDQRLASPAPELLSWEEAAAVPIVFQVAHDMLWQQGHLARGEWLLVAGVSSGVGVACLQAAQVIGAQVIGTSRSKAKLERLKPLGLAVGIETGGARLAEAVLAATGGKGADLVVNNVGGSVFAECVACMAFGGRLATVGYLDRSYHADIDLNRVHARRLHVFGVSARYRPVEERARSLKRFRRELLPALGDGRIRPLVDAVFAFDQLAQARHRMESDEHLGKIVISLQEH